MKFAILGEDKSDASTLKVLVRRLLESAPAKRAKEKKPAIKPKNYHGWSHLCRKGARDLRQLARAGCDRFIVCVDADGPDPAERRRHIQREVIAKAGLDSPACCLVIPVQELEAWLLADIEQAGPKVILSWRPSAIKNPERQASPKEHLRRLSVDPGTRKARYNEVLHNERLAEHLRLDRVEAKCASFKPLVDFVRK